MREKLRDLEEGEIPNLTNENSSLKEQIEQMRQAGEMIKNELANENESSYNVISSLKEKIRNLEETEIPNLINENSALKEQIEQLKQNDETLKEETNQEKGKLNEEITSLREAKASLENRMKENDEKISLLLD